MRLSMLSSCLALSCALSIAAPAGEAPKLRLGDSVLPRHFAVEMTLEPGKDTFSGVVDIDVEVRQPQDTIWLNAVDLTIHDVSIGGMPARTVAGNSQVVGLSTGQVVPAGLLHVPRSGRRAGGLDGPPVRG